MQSSPGTCGSPASDRRVARPISYSQMIVQLRRVLTLAGAGSLTLVSACESQKPKYEGPYAAEVAQAVPMIQKAVGPKFKTPPKIQTRSKGQVREFLSQPLHDS